MSYLTSVINTYRLGGIIMLLLCCSCESPEDLSKEYPFPSDNPPSAQKIELGRALFFDKRLSLDESVACADCHNPSYAFTDRKAVSDGINGKHSERNAPTLLNSAFLKTVMFDAHLKTLELQVIVPIQEATEMGHNMKVLIPKLRAIPEYQKAAKTLFNRDFDAWVLTRSIAAFERSLISLNSPYDQFMRGNKQALTSDQRAGMKLFNTLYCTTCHPAPYFTNFNAENNGLYKEYGTDKGRFRINLDSADIGFFKTPTLRNIELTYPYMHDGSLKSLDEVIEHYLVGGKHPKGQHPSILPLELTPREKKQLISFLSALTDTSYLKNFQSHAP
jgi:cytochrome c peroxidase